MTTWCRCCQREDVAFYPRRGRICRPCNRVEEALRKYWRAWQIYQAGARAA